MQQAAPFRSSMNSVLSREVLFISRNSTMVETKRFSLVHLPDLASIAQWQARFIPCRPQHSRLEISHHFWVHRLGLTFWAALCEPGRFMIPPRHDPMGKGDLFGDPFPGNVIPSARFSPVSAKFQSFFPQLTSPNQLANNYVGAGGLGINTENSTVAKIDHLLAHGRISASHRYSRAPGTTVVIPITTVFRRKHRRRQKQQRQIRLQPHLWSERD